MPNETTLRFMPDGEMVALVRREAGNRSAWVGRSLAPYTTWTWRETTYQVGRPNFIRLPDGELWASGRRYPGGPTTVLARMTLDGGYERVLTLPSAGDTSYAGMVWHEGLLSDSLLFARRQDGNLPGARQASLRRRELRRDDSPLTGTASAPPRTDTAASCPRCDLRVSRASRSSRPVT